MEQMQHFSHQLWEHMAEKLKPSKYIPIASFANVVALSAVVVIEGNIDVVSFECEICEVMFSIFFDL